MLAHATIELACSLDMQAASKYKAKAEAYTAALNSYKVRRMLLHKLRSVQCFAK